MTKQDLMARIARLVDEGAVMPIGPEAESVRLDEISEAAVDVFGGATAGIDLDLDRFVDAWPTGDRRWSSYDGETDGVLIINNDTLD